MTNQSLSPFEREPDYADGRRCGTLVTGTPYARVPCVLVQSRGVFLPSAELLC